MLSVIPEYMGLGLSSGLLRNSEYLLHEAGTSEMPRPRMYPDITLHRRLKEWASMTSIRRV